MLIYYRFRKRSARHQLLTLGVFSLGLCFALPLGLDLGYEAWESLAPRSPLGSMSRRPILLCVDHLTDEQRQTIAESPESIPAHQIQPHLALVGIGEEVKSVNTTTCQDALQIGLLPSYADALARDDTRLSLALEAPSLTLLSEDLFNSPRGQALRRNLSHSREQLVQRGLKLWPKLRAIFEQTLGAELGEKLFNDKVIRETLKSSLSRELVDRVAWDKVGESIAADSATAELQRLALKHVSVGEIARGAVRGLSQGVSRGVDDLKTTSAKVNREGDWWWDTAICTLKMGVPTGVMGLTLAGTLDPTTASVASSVALKAFGGVRSDLCAQLMKSVKGAGSGALSSGMKSFAKQSFESLRVNSEASLSQAQVLAGRAWETAQGGVRLKGVWLSVAGNQELKDYVVQTYGEPAWQKLTESTLSLTKSAEVEGLVDEATKEIKRAGKQSLTALLLDREGKGPNPLLLAVIQEQLSGQVRPIIRVVNGSGSGSGKPTPEGYVFQRATSEMSRR